MNRIRLILRGMVQGVGMRPCLHRLALKNGICGWTRNTSGGLEAELEGPPGQLSLFLDALQKELPPLAVVEELSVQPLEGVQGYSGFSILESHSSLDATLISPDMAPCPACEKELFSPADRRYRYPFINCTDCGPRYTIVRALPYDRAQTVMASFPMCQDCRTEYENIESRRYHAQPDCCPDCGPSVSFLDENGQPADGDPVALARRLLTAGKILAVKGTGGIHLACDAKNPDAVARLRERKNRPVRPLALMCADLLEAGRICSFSPEEAALLKSTRRPIVLLRKKDPAAFSDISFGRRLGIMLPYTPLHLLLLHRESAVLMSPDSEGARLPRPCQDIVPPLLVMTSANQKGCPVLTDDAEARCTLSGIADGFLFHNRPIENRCDDSLMTVMAGGPCFLRRSRGYAPQPLPSKEDVSGICAFGAEQKGSFALGREMHIFLSPHIGDLKNAETFDHYSQTLRTYIRLFKCIPSHLVCDLHPDYLSAQAANAMAEKQKLPLLQVQHHWAHMTSCMADNRLNGPAFGIIWDGTGLGTDGSVWGAEFLTGDFGNFKRSGSIRPISLPGGDRATEEIGRIALSLLQDAGLPVSCAPLPPGKRQAVQSLLSSGISCPKASSMGRLFDGISALIFQKQTVSYDGEAACLLEAMSTEETPLREELVCAGSPWPLLFYEEAGVRRFDTRPVVQAAVQELKAGVSTGEIARHFMLTLCHMALDQCIALNPRKLPVVLSGGVFLNRFLLEGIRTLLTQAGFSVFSHNRVSACDEGICLGQLSIAAAQRRFSYVSCNSHEA